MKRRTEKGTEQQDAIREVDKDDQDFRLDRIGAEKKKSKIKPQGEGNRKKENRKVSVIGLTMTVSSFRAGRIWDGERN